jgi:hypothetical protein
MSSTRPHRLHDLLRLPFRRGRLLWSPDTGEGGLIASQYFQSHLDAKLIHPDGTSKKYDLGSGLVTNVGVMAMAYDWSWSAQLNLSTINLANNHATGTGSTAAATTDIACQTLASPTTVTAVAGAQSVTPVANAWTYKTVATINYTTSLAITEWGLHSLITLTASTGTPFTAAAAASWQDTGSAQTASSATVRGLQQTIVVPGTTTVFALNLSNTTHVATIPAWYTVAAGTAGSTPGATETFVIKPVLWDHKVFSAINVNNGDSIQFTYSLLINSGG